MGFKVNPNRKLCRQSGGLVPGGQSGFRQSQRSQHGSRGQQRGARTGWTIQLVFEGIAIAESLPSRLPAGRIGLPT